MYQDANGNSGYGPAPGANRAQLLAADAQCGVLESEAGFAQAQLRDAYPAELTENLAAIRRRINAAHKLSAATEQSATPALLAENQGHLWALVDSVQDQLAQVADAITFVSAGGKLQRAGASQPVVGVFEPLERKLAMLGQHGIRVLPSADGVTKLATDQVAVLAASGPNPVGVATLQRLVAGFPTATRRVAGALGGFLPEAVEFADAHRIALFQVLPESVVSASVAADLLQQEAYRVDRSADLAGETGATWASSAAPPLAALSGSVASPEARKWSWWRTFLFGSVTFFALLMALVVVDVIFDDRAEEVLINPLWFSTFVAICYFWWSGWGQRVTGKGGRLKLRASSVIGVLLLVALMVPWLFG